ncbi:hypothetical protein Daus18300_000548 [Diaporthe australafricana]|uniref:F-box domain-containing protein n=1 Tax=Diaporthe australafricana TaxID=127596 RepID=A0ABR3Y3M8_9PEZI
MAEVQSSKEAIATEIPHKDPFSKGIVAINQDTTSECKGSTMQSLALQHHRDAGHSQMALITGPRATFGSLPNETIFEILENLTPAHDTIDPVFVGSKALATAQERLNALQALCLASKRMEAMARPYLWRVIVIPDPNKLICLQRSIAACPTLGLLIKSLAVHQNHELSKKAEMSLRELSRIVVAILEKTPRLVALSMIGLRKEQHAVEDSQPPPFLVEILKRDISLAKDASHDTQFLPDVEILGLLYCKGTRTKQRFIVEDLLDLPSLRHIVYHYEQDFSPTDRIVIYDGIFKNRSLPLRTTITSLDWLRLVAPSHVFNLCSAPKLETLKIPLRYFRDYERPDQMLRPSDVLPKTLKSLTVSADLRYNASWHRHKGENGWTVNDDADESNIRPFPSVPWTMGFLRDLEGIVDNIYPNLVEVTLEYTVDDPKEAGVSDGDDISRSVIDKKGLGAQLQGLGTSFGKKGVQFRWIERQWPPKFTAEGGN